MSFASYDFLFMFLPLAVLFTWLALSINANRLLIPTIIITSIIFYGYTSFPHLLLLLVLIILTWLMGVIYSKSGNPALGKLAIAIGVLSNLSSLLVWKYGTSIIETWNQIGWIQATDPGLIMPLGISFYALQMIGFLLDLQRGKTTTSPLPSFAAFVLFFPQLLAGPIVSHKRMMLEFGKSRTNLSMDQRVDMASLGIAWIAIGLFKKAVIADSLARITIPLIVGASANDLTMIEAWQIVLSSGPRLYFDFSGYCDMAVGIGLLFGISLPHNFNAPGRWATITDGWRRWHITFHNFLRDHVYRNLKNRFGASRLGLGVSTLIVFLISALWHGNNLFFLVWGLLCGISWVILTSLLSLPNSRYKAIAQKSLVGLLYLFMPLIFVVPDMNIAMFVVSQLIAFDQLPNNLLSFEAQGGWYLGVIIVIIIYFISEISTQILLSNKFDHRDRTIFGLRPPVWVPDVKWAVFILLLLVIAFYFVGKSPPFVYFKF
ncbi:MAG: MBOAT family O-acyltransferase [Hellea sp.]